MTLSGKCSGCRKDNPCDNLGKPGECDECHTPFPDTSGFVSVVLKG